MEQTLQRLSVREEPYRGPIAGQVVFTKNIDPDDITNYLANSSAGFELFSLDTKQLADEDVATTRAVLNEIAGKAQYAGPVSSLAARVARKHNSQDAILRGYGSIVLVLNYTSIQNDVAVFNGDFKTLGYNHIRDKKSDGRIRTFRPREDPADLARELDSYMNPRPLSTEAMYGAYFEARLYRSLRPIDVSEVYFLAGDSSAKDAAHLLEEAWLAMKAPAKSGGR